MDADADIQEVDLRSSESSAVKISGQQDRLQAAGTTPCFNRNAPSFGMAGIGANPFFFSNPGWRSITAPNRRAPTRSSTYES
jgi:hypothetical protein